MTKTHLLKVVDYMEGKLDIYDSKHQVTLEVWNELWDELNYMGYNPETIGGIKRYIREQL